MVVLCPPDDEFMMSGLRPADLPAMGLLIALATGVSACGRQLPQSQFGVYYRQTKHLILPSGDSVKVYRVKYWIFESGPPALQLEYEPPFAVSDTAAVHREARLLWPFFAPYVEAKGLTGGIVTATNLHVYGIWPILWTSRSKSFGFVAQKGRDGRWRFENDTVPLPAA